MREPESMIDIQELLLLTQNNVLYPRMPLSDSQLVCYIEKEF